MHRSLLAALALAATFVASSASAQTVIIVEPPPPPPVIVVVEPPPPAQVVVVEAPPSEPAPPTPSGPPPRWLVDLTGDFLIGAGYDFPSFGATVRGGVMFDSGYTLQLAARYAGSFDDGPEVSLGVELQRDFSPSQPLGFLLLARVGSAFLLEDRGPFDAGIRVDGQIGVGGRFDLGSDVAILVDLRGVIRFRPDDPDGPSGDDVSGGFVMTMGLRIRL